MIKIQAGEELHYETNCCFPIASLEYYRSPLEKERVHFGHSWRHISDTSLSRVKSAYFVTAIDFRNIERLYTKNVSPITVTIKN